MNLRITGKAFILFCSLALVLFGLSGFIEQSLGWQGSLLSEAWKLVAIAVGLSLASGFVYPWLRGVKPGDQLITFMKQDLNQQGLNFSFINASLVTSLQAGRKGGKIRVRLGNGLHGEGIILDYAGTLTPARIQLTETEVPQARPVRIQ
ncbi:MAG: hypothetical protein V1834_02020 [Candidatus Micrarchaeota archaeon]